MQTVMKNFQIHHRHSDEIEVLEISGELDAHTASKLEDSLKSLIDKNRHNIIVNCSDLEYIASAGLGVFMAYIEDVRGLGGDIKLTNMNERVYNVFDLLGFPTLYDIFDDEEEAVKQFQNSDQ
jgi:anti-sigma B factor antagonist